MGFHREESSGPDAQQVEHTLRARRGDRRANSGVLHLSRELCPEEKGLLAAETQRLGRPCALTPPPELGVVSGLWG